MRNVINLNEGWRFVKEDAVVPAGMRRTLKHRSSRWAAAGYLWKFWRPDSRQRYM